MPNYFSGGGEVLGQDDASNKTVAEQRRVAVIVYDNSLNQFVYSAKRWSYYLLSSYICQLQTGPSVVQSHSILLKCVLLSRLFSREKLCQ